MTATEAQSESPALKFRSQHYQPRFRTQLVPKTICMLVTVEPDKIEGLGLMPGWEGVIAVADRKYPAWTNSSGAVAAVMEDGRKLGVKPDEFEVVEFFT